MKVLQEMFTYQDLYCCLFGVSEMKFSSAELTYFVSSDCHLFVTDQILAGLKNHSFLGCKSPFCTEIFYL